MHMEDYHAINPTNNFTIFLIASATLTMSGHQHDDGSKIVDYVNTAAHHCRYTMGFYYHLCETQHAIKLIQYHMLTMLNDDNSTIIVSTADGMATELTHCVIISHVITGTFGDVI